MKSRSLILSIILLVSIYLLPGCARTLAPETDILQLELSITFREAPNPDVAQYLIAFSSTTLEPANPIVNDYYIFPGKTTNSSVLASLGRTITDYYAAYYSTWNQFIYIANSSAELIQSTSTGSISDVFFDPTTTDTFAYQESIGFQYTMTITNQTLTIVIDIDQLGYVKANTANVSLFTFRPDTHTDSGYIQDFLGSSHLITFSQYEENNVSALENTSIDGQTDILSWSYRLY